MRLVWTTVLALCLISVLAVSVDARRFEDDDTSTLEEAKEYLLEGRYTKAERRFRSVLRDDEENMEALLGVVRCNLERGDHEDALEYIATALEVEPGNQSALAMQCECHWQTGSIEELEGVLETWLEGDASNLQALKYSARVHDLFGRREEALVAYDSILDYQRNTPGLYNYEEGGDPEKSGIWTIVGEACEYHKHSLGSSQAYRSANDAYTEALKADPLNYEAACRMGNMWLDTQKDVDGRRFYQMVTNENEYHAEGLAGEAMCRAFRYDMQNALECVETALRTNPRSSSALRFMANFRLTNQDYWNAREQALAALEVNEYDREAKALLAASEFMAGNPEEADRLIESLLEQDPGCSMGHRFIADMYSASHRFDSAIEWYERALEIDERDWDAYAAMGMACTRRGYLERAREVLDLALENDAMRQALYTRNMLMLLDSMDEDFEVIRTTNFVIRVHNSEEAVMGEYMADYLEECYHILSRKYNFYPEGPIDASFYHHYEDFQVRVLGIPGIPALGVCFGHAISVISPNAVPPGQFSWARTTWHEMAHVYQIQLSDGRVPRWLAEGMSVWEERQRRPEWDRQQDLELFQRYTSGQIISIETLNNYFSGNQVLWAYFQASYDIEFIVDRHGGVPTLVAMCRAFGESKSTPQVIQEVLGISCAQFNEQFLTWLDEHYISQWKMLGTVGADRLAEIRDQLTTNPYSAELNAELALGYYQRGNAEEAAVYAERAHELDEEAPIPLYVLGMVAFASEDPGAALRHLSAAEDLGLEDFWLYLTLGKLNIDLAPWGAVDYLQLAKEAFPKYVAQDCPYAILHQLYMQQGREREAWEEIEQYVAIVETDFESRIRLAEYFRDSGDSAKQLKYLLEANYVNPFILQIHKDLGDLYVEMEDPEHAIAEYRVTIALNPDDPVECEVLCRLAEICINLGRYSEAERAISDCDLLNPEYPALQGMRELLEESRPEEDEPGQPDEPGEPEAPEDGE